MLMDDVRGELVLRRLPREILESLTPQQVAAIRHAGGYARPRRHPIDARFGLRLPFFGRTYIVILVGKDMRSRERVAAEKSFRATDRVGQIVLLLLGASTLLFAALIGILLQNALAGH